LAIKFRITVEESFGLIQKLLVLGFKTNANIGKLPLFGRSSRINRYCLRLKKPVSPDSESRGHRLKDVTLPRLKDTLEFSALSDVLPMIEKLPFSRVANA
jgi:hypothetical protein